MCLYFLSTHYCTQMLNVLFPFLCRESTLCKVIGQASQQCRMELPSPNSEGDAKGVCRICEENLIIIKLFKEIRVSVFTSKMVKI